MVSKDELRIFTKNKRKEITNKIEKEIIITKKLLNHSKIKISKNILIYISTNDEVSTINLIKELFKLNKNVYAPRVIEKNINFYKINSLEELKLSKHKILEPISDIEYKFSLNSVCIVPGLLFDKLGNRLGYGGGYYDRFLSNNNIYKIGVCFSEFLIDKLDTLEHDIKMDEVITEVL